MTHPVILERLRGVQRAGTGWIAYCPAHDDKNKRSLSVGMGDDGRTLVNCLARGCTADAIVRAVGMELRDLAPTTNGRPEPSGRIVIAYNYTDGAGRLLFQVVRFEPKTLNSAGRTAAAAGLEARRRPPRPLPPARPGAAAPVILLEGEKDADRLAALGIASTTSPGGARRSATTTPSSCSASGSRTW